jgi:mono/diheme cytochrome c family protein
MGVRRQVAWDIVKRTLDPVPLLGLADAAASNETVVLANGQVPKVPRYQTWYGVDDFKRMFRRLFSNLSPEDRAKRTPFTDQSLDEVEQWNAKAAERSNRWPLQRFLDYVNELGECKAGVSDADCARSLQSKFSGAAAGNSRITYSPGTMRHLLKNYGAILKCLKTLDTVTMNTPPADEDQNFSYCFEQEFPVNAVLVKAHWMRADFGRIMPAFDTTADALEKVVGFGATGDWADGDRDVDPSPNEILTIRLKNTDSYRLAGLHIMTKELRHWVWITLWWSDTPDSDFGADRPADVRSTLDPVWSNYKMSVVVDYDERDPDVAQWFPEHPSLAAALKVVNDGFSWSSNPYIEHGRGNAKTNCIGCHQHGGITMGPDLNGDSQPDPFDLDLVIDSEILFPSNGRIKQRTLFPADYLWSTQRVDKLSQVVVSEVGNFDNYDKDVPEVRAIQVLALEGAIVDGAATFAKNCAQCHGEDGKGTLQAPSLYKRVPKLADAALVVRLIIGLSPMPAWAELSNQTLADLRAYLRSNFDTE